MKSLNVANDIIPIAKVKAHLAETVRRVKNTGCPVVITQNGIPAAVLIAPEDFDLGADRTHFLAAIDRGFADVAAGRVYDKADVDAAVGRALSSRRRR